MKRNRGKQQDGKDQRSPQENWSYQGNISCKDVHNKELYYGEMDMELKDFADFVDRQNWIFAKTYADRAPNEYIVRDMLYEMRYRGKGGGGC